MNKKRIVEIVGSIAVIAGLIFFFIGNRGTKELTEAHNKMVQIEGDFVNAVNSISATSEKEINSQFIRHTDNFQTSLKGVDLSACPEDYKAKFSFLLTVIGNMKSELADEDYEGFEISNEIRLKTTRELNEIAEKHGMQILE